MQAVVTIQGKQFFVEPGARIRVDSIDSEVGTNIQFDTVALTNDGKKVTVGKSDHIVKAEVLAHGLGKKIRVFKHHAKKRYRRTQGHRQGYTELRIAAIEASKS